MSWFYLIVAGLFEMLAVLFMNEVQKKKKWQQMALMICSFVFSFLFLAFAMEGIAMGVAYAIWTGIGASGGAIIGILLYKESSDWRRIVCIFLIISSVVGLKLVS